MKNPLKKVYMPRFHISEPKFGGLPTYRKRCIVLLYGNRIMEHTIQYDRNTTNSAEKSVLGQTIQNSFDPSIVLFENNCPYMSKYLAILIKAEPI